MQYSGQARKRTSEIEICGVNEGPGVARRLPSERAREEQIKFNGVN